MPNINPGILEGVRRIPLRIRDLVIEGGVPGAPLGFRVRGALTVGPPASGTWRAGDVVADRRGILWTCTTAGTPGYWSLTPNVLYPSGDTTGATDIVLVQNAANAIGSSAVLVLAAGNWYFNTALTVPAGVRVAGVLGDINDTSVYGTTIHTPHSTWAQGSAAYAAAIILGTDAQFDTCNLNCHFANSNGMDGVTSSGNNVRVQDLNIYNGPQYGINARGTTWRGWRVMVTQSVLGGFLAPASDSDWIDCNSSASQAHGWICNNPINSRLIGCRAEFNTTYGFSITGDSTATGGFSMIGCTTDRNGSDAVHINSTGNWPITINSPMFRRDGSSGGTTGAVNVAATNTSPVVIDGMQVFPGFNDDGSGTQSPITGITVGAGATYVSVSNSFIHAVTTPVSGVLSRASNVSLRTGSWNGPGAVYRYPDTVDDWEAISSGYTLANNTSAQPLLNGTASGAVTLPAGAYFFEGSFDVTGLSGSSHTTQLGFGGTATISSVRYTVDSNTGAASTLATWQTAVITSASATSITAASTTTTVAARVRGIMRVSASGTVIPQITQLTASAAAVVSANSWFRFQMQSGSSTAVSSGPWT